MKAVTSREQVPRHAYGNGMQATMLVVLTPTSVVVISAKYPAAASGYEEP
jgi:hypothetical protein